MKKILLLVSLILMLCSSIGYAANWQWVASTDKLTMSLNTEDILRVNGEYIAWTQIKVIEYAQYVENGQKIAVRLEKLGFKKTETGNEFRLLEYCEYNKDGNLVKSGKGDMQWDSIPPNSLAEGVFKKVLEIRSAADKEDDAKELKEKKKQQRRETNNIVANIGAAILGSMH